MKTGRLYRINDREIMVLDGIANEMPGQKGLALLANRRAGVGADRVLVFTGTEEQPSMRVYDSKGNPAAADRLDYIALACYLREQQIAPNMAEMVKHLGATALQAGDFRGGKAELHITEYFWQQVLRMDAGRLCQKVA